MVGIINSSRTKKYKFNMKQNEKRNDYEEFYYNFNFTDF